MMSFPSLNALSRTISSESHDVVNLHLLADVVVRVFHVVWRWSDFT